MCGGVRVWRGEGVWRSEGVWVCFLFSTIVYLALYVEMFVIVSAQTEILKHPPSPPPPSPLPPLLLR